MMSRRCPDRDMMSPASRKSLLTKEHKEMKKLIQKIVKDLMIDRELKLKDRIESQCKDDISKAVDIMRQDFIRVETSFASRNLQLEEKLSTVRQTCEDSKKVFTEQCSSFNTQISKIEQGMQKLTEHEKLKRQEVLKRIQKQFDASATENLSHIKAAKDLSDQSTATIANDLKIHSNEILRLKESLEDLLLKRYGLVPGNKPNSELLATSFNQGLDAGVILDQLSVRVKAVEENMHKHAQSQMESLSLSRGGGGDYGMLSPEPSSKNKSKLTGRAAYRRDDLIAAIPGLEEAVSEVQLQMQDFDCQLKDFQRTVSSISSNSSSQLAQCQQQQQDLLARVTTALLEIKHSNTAPNAVSGASIESSCAARSAAVLSEHEESIKSVKKKLRDLGESTSTAVRSLSVGLNDLQQSSLFVYSWADKAQAAIGVCADRVGLLGNPCPKVQIHSGSSVAAVSGVGMGDHHHSHSQSQSHGQGQGQGQGHAPRDARYNHNNLKSMSNAKRSSSARPHLTSSSSHGDRDLDY